MSIRRAQLYAEAVTVLCPHCGCEQPNPDGSLMWTPEDFNKPGASGTKPCVSCDTKILITTCSRASFG